MTSMDRWGIIWRSLLLALPILFGLLVGLHLIKGVIE